MTDNKLYQTPVSSKVAKVAASISLLKNHIKQSKRQNKSQEIAHEPNYTFNDSSIKSEFQLKTTPQKQIHPIIPSTQSYPIKSLGQRPIIRFIQKSKQIMKINQMFRQKQLIELSDFLPSKVESHQHQQQNNSLFYDENLNQKSSIDDKTDYNFSSSDHTRYTLKTEGSSRIQNSYQLRSSFIPEAEDWGYSVKTDQDEIQINESPIIDQSPFQRQIKTSSGKINRKNSRNLQSSDKNQLSDDKSGIFISAWRYDSKQDEKMCMTGKKIDQLQFSSSIENHSSLQKNNYLNQENNATITNKKLPQFGNQAKSQYSIRTRSCEFRPNKQNQAKNISLSNAHHTSQNYNSSLSNLTFNEIDQSQNNQEEQQEKLKSNKIFKIILNQIHKARQNDKSLVKFPHNQEEISFEKQNNCKENEIKYQNNQDGNFFKQIKNSQKILSKLQNKSSDTINQIKQIQDIQVQGQSLRHRLGEVNIEKIIRTLKQQKKQGNHYLVLKGSNLSPQKQEQQQSQNSSSFQCWKDFSEPNLSSHQFIHINSLNKNPKAQVREVEVQKIFQNETCSPGRQCSCKHNNCIQDEVQQLQNYQNEYQQSILASKDSEKPQINDVQNQILKSSGVNLNPNSNHINFRRPAKKDLQTRQTQKSGQYKENTIQEDDKQCSGWESTSAFNQTAESAFLEFVQANLKKRQNIINLIKNGK